MGHADLEYIALDLHGDFQRLNRRLPQGDSECLLQNTVQTRQCSGRELRFLARILLGAMDARFAA